LSATLWQQTCSLGLEYQEGFVAAFEEVEEASPFGVVGDRQGEVLATDDVPSSASIFGQFMGAKLSLNFSCDQFVKVVLLVGSLTDSDDLLDDVERHIGESNSILGHRDLLPLRMFF